VREKFWRKQQKLVYDCIVFAHQPDDEI